MSQKNEYKTINFVMFVDFHIVSKDNLNKYKNVLFIKINHVLYIIYIYI